MLPGGTSLGADVNAAGLWNHHVLADGVVPCLDRSRQGTSSSYQGQVVCTRMYCQFALSYPLPCSFLRKGQDRQREPSVSVAGLLQSEQQSLLLKDQGGDAVPQVASPPLIPEDGDSPSSHIPAAHSPVLVENEETTALCQNAVDHAT